MKQKKFIPRKQKIDLGFILEFYDAYVRCSNIAKVGMVLDLTGSSLQNRIDKSPALQKAREIADQHRTQRTLPSYVFESLSKEAQQTWAEIRKADSREIVQRIFSRKTKQLRQELFIYALVSSSFDLSSACRMVAMDRVTLHKWKSDLEFLQLMEEIQWHKKNFFESALVGLVEERHPGAVLFANRTINADRGYSEKLQIEHSGSIDTSYSVEQLDLDLDTRRKILEAIRKRKEEEPKQLTSGPVINLPAAA
jgi:hypothetical protein